jgi:hypothetical protein
MRDTVEDDFATAASMVLINTFVVLMYSIRVVTQSWIKHRAEGAAAQGHECSRGPQKIKRGNFYEKGSRHFDSTCPLNRRSGPVITGTDM